jgi:hypothetical protein
MNAEQMMAQTKANAERCEQVKRELVERFGCERMYIDAAMMRYCNASGLTHTELCENTIDDIALVTAEHVEHMINAMKG